MSDAVLLVFYWYSFRAISFKENKVYKNALDVDFHISEPSRSKKSSLKNVTHAIKMCNQSTICYNPFLAKKIAWGFGHNNQIGWRLIKQLQSWNCYKYNFTLENFFLILYWKNQIQKFQWVSFHFIKIRSVNMASVVSNKNKVDAKLRWILCDHNHDFNIICDTM